MSLLCNGLAGMFLEITQLKCAYNQVSQNHKHSKARLSFHFYLIFNVLVGYLSILKEDQLDKLRFIWNPLPSMIIYDDVLSLINLNVQSIILQ